MKLLNVLSTLGLSTLAALAVGGVSSNSAFADHERVERIVRDPILRANMSAVESKYPARCRMRTNAESHIQWRCLNGPGCYYQVDIPCMSDRDDRYPAAHEPPARPYPGPNPGPVPPRPERRPLVIIQVHGFDDGRDNTINTVEYVYPERR